MAVENLGVIERRLLGWAVVAAQHAGNIPIIGYRVADCRNRPQQGLVSSTISVGDGRMPSLLTSWKRCG